MTEAGIYVRISDDRAGTAAGVRRQEKECRALAARRGWKVAKVYTDNSVSAYSGRRRPAYAELLDDIKNRQIGALVVWATDRLYRHPLDLEPLIDLLEADPAFGFDTVTSGLIDLSTPGGRMVARVLAAVNRNESEQKAERHRAKHRQLAEEGRESGGGSRPFGYTADRQALVEAEAAVVADAARRVLAGEAIRSVVRDLNARGVPTVGGRPWTTTVLRRILTNPRSAGLRAHHGQVTARGSWPALFDEVTLRRLQAVLLAPDRLQSPGNARCYLLGGFAVCGRCGAHLVARPREDRRRAYICARGPNFSGCGQIGVLADPLEDLVAAAVFDRLDLAAVGRRLSAVPDRTEDELLAALTDAEGRLERIGAEYGEGSMSREAFRAAERAAVGRLEAARAALARLTTDNGARAWRGRAADLREAWASMDLSQRRAILGGLLESVTIGPAVRGLNRFDPRRVGLTWRV